MDDVIDKIDGVAENTPQVDVKVKIKRNRGLKADILKQLAINPSVSPQDVFEALKCNSYGGSKPVTLSCVQSTMSQIKKRQEVHSPDLKEDKDSKRSFDVTPSDGQDTP